MTCEEQIQFLTKHGASQTGHSDRHLLTHLQGTQRILKEWGARPAVCTAGLFHSVYGTESFQTVTIPLDLRPKVIELIGPEAEALAYIFGARENSSFKANKGKQSHFSLRDRFSGDEITIDKQTWSDLCELFLANALEQIEAIELPRRVQFFENYEWVTTYASGAATNAFLKRKEQDSK
ncbi:MAG: hypothetical protein P1V97_14535 [Planctomycetota bacterium]|nr:hypothetical protein [Planctomycetota bacterium]